MKSIQLLMEEHQTILRMISVMREASLEAIKNHDLVVEDFKAMVAFIRLYADQTHHGKEESYLFKNMLDELGDISKNLVRHGMLVEHDLARLYVSELDAALEKQQASPSLEHLLDIVVAAGSYCELLKRHIHKEDTVVFTYGQTHLSNDAMIEVERAIENFEANEDNRVVREEQLKVLEGLEEKYLLKG